MQQLKLKLLCGKAEGELVTAEQSYALKGKQKLCSVRAQVLLALTTDDDDLEKSLAIYDFLFQHEGQGELL